MGDFLSLGSLNCSNIAGHKGTCSTKVACGHVHKERENWGGSVRLLMLSLFHLYTLFLFRGVFLKQHSVTAYSQKKFNVHNVNLKLLI